MLTRLLPKAEVKKVCPWYFRMKQILGERPNAKPVGIGNSTSELDLDVLVSGTQDDASGLEDTGAILPSENDDDDDGENPQCSDQHGAKNKRSASAAGLDEDVKPRLGTPARPNVSKPTAAGPKPKKMKGLEDLTEIAVAEEATRQKELDLDIQRSKEKASKAQAKAEVEKAAIEAKREKAKLTHELELTKLQLELARTRHVTPGVGMAVSAQRGQDGLHPSGLYPYSPNFGFSDGGRFDGGVGGEEGAGQGSF